MTLWLPDSARELPPHVEAACAAADDPAEARRLALELLDRGLSFPDGDADYGQIAPDSVMLCPPRDWGLIQTELGTKALLSYVECPPLKRMLLDGRVDVDKDRCGIIGEAPDPLLNAHCPALFLQLEQFGIAVPTQWPNLPCPDPDWLAYAVENGFALGIHEPERTDGQVLYVATSPIRTVVPRGIQLPPRARKVGRNERCPCGSGIKHKHCCGRGGPT